MQNVKKRMLPLRTIRTYDTAQPLHHRSEDFPRTQLCSAPHPPRNARKRYVQKSILQITIQ